MRTPIILGWLKVRRFIPFMVTAHVLLLSSVIGVTVEPAHSVGVMEGKSVFQDTSSSRELERAAAIVYKNAVRNFAKGHYWKAALDLIVVLDSYSQFSSIDGVLYYLGECLQEMEMLEAAEKLFNYLLAQDIQSSFIPKSVYGLEKVKYKSKQYQEALDYYRMLQEKFPRVEIDEGPTYYAGQSYFSLNKYRKAIEILALINEQSDYYGYALYSIALAHIKEKEVNQAIESFKKLLALPTIDAIRKNLKEKASLTLGYLYYELKDYEKAISCLSDISSSSADKADALLGIGWSAIKLGDYRRAISALEELVQRFPKSVYIPEANFLLGQSYLKSELYKGAISYFSNILRMFPKSAGTTNVHQMVRVEIEKQEKTIEHMRVSLLIMESKFLDTLIISKFPDTPDYLIEETKKLQTTRKELLKNIIQERKHLARLTTDISQLIRTARTRQIEWRSYAEYGIVRALYLKSRSHR